MKNKKFHQLSLGRRQIIYVMRKEGKSFREIGRAVGCDATTVCRELARNRLPQHVWKELSAPARARYADEKAEKRKRARIRERGCILEGNAKARQFILTQFEETHYSPEDVALIASASDLGIKLSGKTIRRWIARHVPHYQKHFPHRGKRRRKHLTPSRRKFKSAAPEKPSIHERPAVVDERKRAGDLELDMLVCSQSKVSILSVIDRKTRHCWLVRVENLEAQTVRQAIIKVVQKIPGNLRHTCTFDQGSEFAEVSQLEKFFGYKNYFCDPYSAWQKGSVENQNKRVRRYIPKGTDLSTVSQHALDRVSFLINFKPRRCLNGLSSADAWQLELQNARNSLH